MNTLSLTRRQFVASLALAPVAVTLALPAAGESRPPSVEVWKDQACGCCNEWIAHLRKSGFTVTAHDSGKGGARAKAGIASQYRSCHTAFVGGYAIEGHVPAREIRRLLAERPNAIGLAVPGMVRGSPGMEQGGIAEPYNVFLLHRDGGSSVYAKYRP